MSKSNGEVVGVSCKRPLQQYKESLADKMDTTEVLPEDHDEDYVSITLYFKEYWIFSFFYQCCYSEFLSMLPPHFYRHWVPTKSLPTLRHLLILLDISSHFVDIAYVI